MIKLPQIGACPKTVGNDSQNVEQNGLGDDSVISVMGDVASAYPIEVPHGSAS